jgi:polyisoprenoid-binding protein YceI
MDGRRLILALFLAVAPPACDEPKGATASTSTAASAALPPAPPPSPVPFVVEPFGAAVFVLKAPSDKIADVKGLAKAFSGDLSIVPSDLTRTTGNVAVDLSSLETHGAGDDAVDGEATARLRDALEVGKTTVKEPLRLTRFTLRSIDEVSEKNVFDLPRDARSVTLKATGDLDLHGVKQERKVELTLTFTMTGGAVSRVTVRTAQPILVSLPAFGVKPPAPLGSEASVTFELSAKPGPR